MSKLQIVDVKKMERLLFVLGFEKIRQRESHIFYRHPDGKATTIPYHKGRVFARPLIREILREIEITVEDCNNYLKKL
ncbi:MAG: hypothetical protein B5M48_03360 [Candidatus Omnitrophica bacterium 4484_213]|nr:MAG: hypothetical protein B5M48_03360 [Candidatus Omnitrophica bacterium 4484_213]